MSDQDLLNETQWLLKALESLTKAVTNLNRFPRKPTKEEATARTAAAAAVSHAESLIAASRARHAARMKPLPAVANPEVKPDTSDRMNWR